MKKKSIIYVNFSPYENAGKVLEYILDNFDRVILFVFNFHPLGKTQKPGTVQVYEKGKLIREFSLFQMSIKIPVSLIFLLIPLRSSINFLQIFWYCIQLRKDYGKFDVYFTVNAFTAWIGNILRSWGIVNQTIFWVWDYYPPMHHNKIILFMRWVYWQFDKNVTIASDSVVFLNKRLVDLRRDINIIPLEKKFPVIPIGTDPIDEAKKKNLQGKTLVIGFLGVLKRSQGLDLFFDAAKDIKKAFPKCRLEIIGAGPDEAYFRQRAKNSPIPTTFYGFVPNDSEVKKIQQTWDIGIALYVPEESNVSYYTDPSKIKGYLSLGIPVVITNINFAAEVVREKAGIVVDYHKKEELVAAFTTIVKNYPLYQKHALSLAKKYHFKRIYTMLFALS